MALKRNIILICTLWLLLVSCAANSGYYPMAVKDARGKLVAIKSKPVRIVSIAPSNTEILYSLGLDNRIVGVTQACDYPYRARKKRKVGGMSISAEMVLGLKPDLILAHSVINDSVIVRLEKLGLTVFAVNPQNMSEVVRDIRTIGRITARPKTADSVAKKMEKSIKAIKAERANKKSKKVLVVIQDSPLWVAGPNTFVDEMIRIAHGVNISHDARRGYVTFSKELAISRNPDVIIVGLNSEKQYFMRDPAWRKTNAVKHNHVFVINNDLIVRPTPRLVIGLKYLAEKMNQ